MSTKEERMIGAAIAQAGVQSDKETPPRECDKDHFVQDWPDAVLNPPGLVGVVVRWIRESSGIEQPKFALAAGLAVCGALLGRGVRDFTGQRTNIYVLVVGGTSAGKNDPVKIVVKLISAMGADYLILGELTSDSALEMHLNAFPVRLFLLDEVGQYLSTIKGAGKSNGYVRTVIPALTRCWSAAGGLYQGKARAKDGNGNLTVSHIKEPCVCLYGTSAPDVLFDAMTTADFSDGSISRFIAFISESRPRFEAKPEIVVPDDLVKELKAALAALKIPIDGVKDKDGYPTDKPTATLVDETDEAKAAFATLENVKYEHLLAADAGDKTLHLYGKIVENARRIALIVAALRNPSRPLIEKSDADYACELMLYATQDMVATVRDSVSTNRTERNKQKLRLIIRKAGECGITQSDLTRRTQTMKTYERDEAIQDLIEAEVIQETQEQGIGKKSVSRYFYRG